MVRFGSCQIVCLECLSSCGLKTQIQRDKGWEVKVTSKSCQHFQFWIDLYTKNSFTPLCVGNHDEISFKMHMKCKKCSEEFVCTSNCTQMNNNEGSDAFECHYNRAVITYKYENNRFINYIKQLPLVLFYPYGLLIGGLSQYVENKCKNLEVFTMSGTDQ